MRLIIFVPPARGAIRTSRAIAYGADHLGHTIIRDQPITTSAEVRAILSLGEADMVACRPRHLHQLDPDLHARALPIPVVRAYRGLIAAIGLPWLVEQIRRHPGRAAATAALAGIAAAVVLLAPRDDEQPPPGAIAPPSLSPGPTATGRPPQTAPPRRSSSSTPSLTAAQPSSRPRRSGPAVTSTVAPVVEQSTTPRPSSPPTRPPTSSPTAPSSAPPETPPAEVERLCILRLHLLGTLDVGVCLGHPSS